jgi:predicted ATP-grasp superfamily ATP-dependent carboligase
VATILVSDGEQRSALAVVRSLHRAGHTVHVSGRTARTLASVSRASAAALITRDPLTAPDAFVDAVAAYVARERIDVVVPITEAALLALLPARARLAPAIVPFPSLETFRRVSDKLALADVARCADVAFPEQRILHAPAEAASLDPGSLAFPIVVKPSRSVGEDRADGVRAQFTVRHAADATALGAVLATFPAAAYPLLIQRRIIGPGRGVFLLMWDGEIIARFAHRRIREKPPSGGVSVCAESVVADPALVERSAALLRAVGWQGVAMVEYKVDAATGIPYLMEINGRFWGSLQLAIDAGVDFPALLVDRALGGGSTSRATGSGSPLPIAVTAYRPGLRRGWWWGEVDHLLARLRRSRRALALPAGEPGRLAAVGAFLRSCVRGGDAVFRVSDPAPFVLESVQWLRRR